MTQLQLQHTKNVFLVIPDQLQTCFSSTGNISIEKNHTIITESPSCEHNYAATVIV